MFGPVVIEIVLCYFHKQVIFSLFFKTYMLRVQNEQFWRKKDSFSAILKREYSFRRDSNPRSMDYEANSLYTTELSDLLMNGHNKIAYI